MYSEENEKLAEAAYNNWLAKHPSDPTWNDYRAKHVFRDLVLTYQRRPHVKFAISELEQCVVDALAGAKDAPAVAAAPIPEPVIVPEKAKPAKAVKK